MSLTPVNQLLSEKLEFLDLPEELQKLIFWYAVVLPPWKPGQQISQRAIPIKLFTVTQGDKTVVQCTWEPELFAARGDHIAEVKVLDPVVTTRVAGFTAKTHRIGPLIPMQKVLLDWTKAVQTDGRALRHVRAQTHKLCLMAVNNNGLALEFVRWQNLQICLAAVTQNGMALRFVQTQNATICTAAVKQTSKAFKYVKRMHENACMDTYLFQRSVNKL